MNARPTSTSSPGMRPWPGTVFTPVSVLAGSRSTPVMVTVPRSWGSLFCYSHSVPLASFLRGWGKHLSCRSSHWELSCNQSVSRTHHRPHFLLSWSSSEAQALAPETWGLTAVLPGSVALSSLPKPSGTQSSHLKNGSGGSSFSEWDHERKMLCVWHRWPHWEDEEAEALSSPRLGLPA